MTISNVISVERIINNETCIQRSKNQRQGYNKIIGSIDNGLVVL